MKRLTSIDSTRGLVMVLMLVDHLREFFYMRIAITDPMKMTTPWDLFITRVSAHLCAPLFVLLTGLAAALFSRKNSLTATSDFLLRRGLFLILLEFTVISFGWAFTFPPATFYLQVIWAIGVSMVALSALLWLPKKLLLALSLAIIFGHNLLDAVSFAPGTVGHTLWSILHERSNLELFGFLKVRTTYPVLPWIGVIGLGFSLGGWFEPTVSSETRQRFLTRIGLGSLAALALLRSANFYGDLHPRLVHGDLGEKIMSFFNLTKYPPSLDFLLFSLGLGFLILRSMDKENAFSRFLKTFGQTPLFFYVLHLYVAHALYASVKSVLGPNHEDRFSLPNVWSLWLIAALLLPPLWFACRWYGEVKRRSQHPLLKYF